MLTKTVPFKHQDHVTKLSRDAKYFGLFMEQGTGKSQVMIATWTYMFQMRRINAVLILAPNGVHDNWAKNEIPKHCILDPDTMPVAVWHSGMSARRMRHWEATINANPEQLPVLCANIECCRSETWFKQVLPFLRRQTLVIIDESTTIKNPKAQQTKGAFRIGTYADYSRILTGTPITQSPLDLWAQCRFLDPEALPYPSYTAFKHQFAVEQTMVLGNRTFNKVVSYKNQDKLAADIAGFTYRVLKKDCLDLPPKVYQTRYIELTDQQKKLYKELAEQCVAQLPEGVVTVTTVLTLMTRLHQIVLGYVPNDLDDQLVPIPHNRIRILAELLEENDSKAIIFCRFKQDIRQIAELLNGMEKKFVEYHGEIGTGMRHNATVEFQENEDCRYFIATSAAARGLTLTAATQVIYYSQSYSLETRLQSEDRAHRSGQTETVVYTDMTARNTVEEKIVAALQNKKSLADGVLNRDDVAELLELVTE